ncbi:MAG: hypothetical protein GYB66_08655 [Chloroflexi bacterium]|nr:hypothetical protein [Chloroflexota bacterium]
MDTELILFGRPRFLVNGVPIDVRVKKAVAMVAYLATTGQAHSRERLATLLWPESRSDVARTSLRQVTQTLRATPLAAALVANRNTIGLHPDVTSDVQSFLAYTRFIDYTQTSLSLDAVARLQSAEALYQDDFMQGFSVPGSAEWDDWQDFRRIEFQYQATRIVASLTRYYAQQRLADSGLRMAHRWLEMDPYNEEAHHLAMRLYMLSHQTERALEQYHLLARLLRRDQSRTPDPEIQETYKHILQGDYRHDVDTVTLSSEKAVLALLPKPAGSSSRYDYECQTVLEALSSEKARRAPLIVVHDQENRDAPGLIAAVSHKAEVHSFFPDGILWAALDTSDDFEAVLRLWLDAMRVSVLKSTSKIEHLAWQFHNGQRGRRLLFLLENIPEARHAFLLMPGYVGCMLIVTTSHQEVASELITHAAALITLPPEVGNHSSPTA